MMGDCETKVISIADESSCQGSSSILIYTRKPKDEYTCSLSNSIHFAYSDGKSEYQPLNRNYGILFALATLDDQNVICEKGLKNPYLFKTKEGTFGIVAVRVDAMGEDDPESRGHILLWLSDDLVTFQDCGMMKLHDELFVKESICEFNKEKNVYEIYWQDKDGNHYVNSVMDIKEKDSIMSPELAEGYSKERPLVQLEDINPGNIVDVDENVAKEVQLQWLPIYNTQIHLVTDSVSITSKEQMEEVKAVAVYSDGSTVEKQVEWDCTGVDLSVSGNYTVKGKVLQKSYPFPLASGYADPVILLWNHKYYYLATNDNKNDIGIYVRESDTVNGLFAPGYMEKLILDYNEEKGFMQTFWAPEFHWIGEDLYILFAVSGKQWEPQSHMMRLKKGGDILNAADWEEPIRVKRADGSFLTEDGITLDMTYFKADGVSCVVWSYRKGIGTPMDTGSMVYIATVDEENPTVLTSEPVLLTRPLYGWENIQGTINNEGPYPLITEDAVYITYSGGAACGYTYALGLLSIPRGSDFLDSSAWKKSKTPVLSYYSSDGVYGPGHNSFFRDSDGDIMILYHGETEIVAFGTRCSAMHRVHFDRKGVPVFDVIGERDIKTSLVDVTINVEVI